MAASLLYIFPFPALFSGIQDAAYPYSEPHAVELLVLLSFLFLLNVVRTMADYYLYAGIIAEIILGTVYGTPLAGILPSDWESTFTVLGYLGLIGIVFEGGLSTDLSLLVSNLPLSTICALTGIGLPVAFSFALLQAGFGYAPLEVFAAGAALSSTSLGTTLMALNSVGQGASRESATTSAEKPQRAQLDHGIADSPRSLQGIDSPSRGVQLPDLQRSRIGTVLISAAVIDDVIGLVLSSLIPALAKVTDGGSQTNLAWIVVRPILASISIAAITPIVARFVLRPLFTWRKLGHRWCTPKSPGRPWGSPRILALLSPHSQASAWGTEGHADAVCLVLMVLFVSGFSTIAYYTGSSILYGAYVAGLTLTYLARSTDEPHRSDNASLVHVMSFEEAYARTAGPLQSYLLAPLFFASIGYAIPFLSLWKPVLLWRGILYALLMTLAKLACGVPIVLWSIWTKRTKTLTRELQRRSDLQHTANDLELRDVPAGGEAQRPIATPRADMSTLSARLRASLVPATFMGLAMVARGEIGLLIAQIARGGESSNGAAPLLGDDAFVICIWAILLCTLVSPIAVGYVVNRWKGRITRGEWQ